ncbi:aromatic ring-hydroxylating oxygenase subunit alpha [Sphingomonas profundi]|uniref:aromatic ring-hydroxylating oxygenase subunit alpha n=1 Tax=Alterirhizorhabdus profundi TaxID=2681549 RepID=UPI0012E8B6A9|nr:aromatic ring-hydroxylating dioxygenase subunit alpha [Sphingomonas profundi]
MTETMLHDRAKTYPSVPEARLLPLRGDPMTGDRYYSREFMAREWDGMWTKVWHVGGRMAELEEAGDFIVHNFRKESVLMVRQRDGSVRAFYNSCQHRGNRLVWTGAGGVDRGFSCAYHGWLWGLDGSLKAVQDEDDFPQGNPCGKLTLKEVKCATWGGFIWYTMDPDAPALEDYLYPMTVLLAGRRMETLTRVVRKTITVNTNWKFSPDNFNESYHLPTVHPQMASMIDEDYRNTVFEMSANGHNRMIEQGQPSMRSLHPNEVEPAWEMQLLDWGLEPGDYAGRARDARRDLQRQKRTLGPERGYRYFDSLMDDELTDYFHHTLFPNVTITGTPDGVHFFRTEPHETDPEWCTFDYWYLAPGVEGRDDVPTVYGIRPLAEAELEEAVFGEQNGGHMLGDFVDQDLSVAVAQQKGFHSRGYADSYLSGQESRVRRFHEVLNDYIEGRR